MPDFQSYIDDGDAFARWVDRSPALAERVNRHLLVVASARQAKTVSELVAGRNAVQDLFAIASEAGFVDAAAVFYGQYEKFCFALLPYVQ